MKKRRIISRAVAVILLCALATAAVVYEVNSILRKEHERQVGLFEETAKTIEHNLNMLKVATMTKEPEAYHNNLATIEEGRDFIKTLSFITEEKKDYIDTLCNYIEVLKEKEPALTEMKSLSEDVTKIKDFLTENYSKEDEVSRDVVNEMETKISELKIKTESYHDDVLKTAETINSILDSMVSSIKDLKDCIDTCYENKINEITDDLSDRLKGPVESFTSLNKAFEEGFSFGTINNL